ncbi:MAG: DNA-binding protein [Pseudomonas sp.]|nr:DNA-binding protein [Pseudomonas sp.]
MRNWYSAQELTGQPGLPGTTRAIQIRAQREGWEGQRRLGSKAIEYAFAVLPEATQAALIAASVADEPKSEVVSAPKVIERDAVSASRLTDLQRSVMTARLAFVREIERMSQVVSQQRAIDTLVAHAKSNALSPYLSERVIRANDRKTGDRSLSERTLKRWLADFRKLGETGLAPDRREKDLSVPPWAADFLRCFQRPTKPSVEASYAEFAAKCDGDRPSIHQVRRFLNKLSVEARERGRYSPQELKAFQPFRRRTTKNLLPGDVYTADGHKFDAEVINPHTGKPYLLSPFSEDARAAIAVNKAADEAAAQDAERLAAALDTAGARILTNSKDFAREMQAQALLIGERIGLENVPAFYAAQPKATGPLALNPVLPRSLEDGLQHWTQEKVQAGSQNAPLNDLLLGKTGTLERQLAAVTGKLREPTGPLAQGAVIPAETLAAATRTLKQEVVQAMRSTQQAPAEVNGLIEVRVSNDGRPPLVTRLQSSGGVDMKTAYVGRTGAGS